MSHPGRFAPGKDPVPIVLEAGWASQPVCTGAENLAPHLDSIPRTVQSVASRYTDYTIQAPNRNEYQEYFLGLKAAGA